MGLRPPERKPDIDVRLGRSGTLTTSHESAHLPERLRCELSPNRAAESRTEDSPDVANPPPLIIFLLGLFVPADESSL